jgi:uncharacterized damage-inducible protein DinB
METTNQAIAVILESWDRNQTVLLNLLHHLTPEQLGAKALENSFSIAVHFAHIQHVRTDWLFSVASGVATLPSLFKEQAGTWVAEQDPAIIKDSLTASAQAVREVVLVGADIPIYSHPIHFLQHMLWHEGYHFGQMMLALKAFGTPIDDPTSDKLIWDIWHS